MQHSDLEEKNPGEEREVNFSYLCLILQVDYLRHNRIEWTEKFPFLIKLGTTLIQGTYMSSQFMFASTLQN